MIDCRNKRFWDEIVYEIIANNNVQDDDFIASPDFLTAYCAISNLLLELGPSIIVSHPQIFRTYQVRTRQILMRKTDIHSSLVFPPTWLMCSFRWRDSPDFRFVSAKKAKPFGYVNPKPFIYDFASVLGSFRAAWCVEKYSEKSLNQMKVKESMDVTESVFSKTVV